MKTLIVIDMQNDFVTGVSCFCTVVQCRRHIEKGKT